MLKQLTTKTAIDATLAKSLRIAIVRTDYHGELNDNLEYYCRLTLEENGVPTEGIKTFSVPGSWEIPLMVQKLAKSGQFDAIVTFGIIIKGDTYHFDMIANEVGRALMQLSLEYSLPVALEILAVYASEQAEVRAGKNDKNKGIEGATAVLQMLSVLTTIQK
ncbi:MAG: 6,7-dimethyl-8-ribityllumazine synthase [Patescibacteria group bacterium]